MAPSRYSVNTGWFSVPCPIHWEMRPVWVVIIKFLGNI